MRLDHGGIGALLKSDAIAGMVNEAAERVAEHVRDQGIKVDGIPGKYDLPVKVAEYTTDRAAAAVTLAHPSGIAVQAKHGALTRAASAEGLTIRARG